MKSPEKRGSGSDCGGDTGGGSLAAGLRISSGLLPGDLLWISASAGDKTPAPGGYDLFPGGGVGLAFYQLRYLPGGYPAGLSAGDGLRNPALGENLWQVAATDIFHNLGLFRGSFPVCPVSFEKNFGICKNFVCICGKMGYNKVYENLQISENAEKGSP